MLPGTPGRAGEQGHVPADCVPQARLL